MLVLCVWHKGASVPESHHLNTTSVFAASRQTAATDDGGHHVVANLSQTGGHAWSLLLLSEPSWVFAKLSCFFEMLPQQCTALVGKICHSTGAIGRVGPAVMIPDFPDVIQSYLSEHAVP